MPSIDCSNENSKNRADYEWIEKSSWTPLDLLGRRGTLLSISTPYVDRLWNKKYERLVEFREEWEHCLVPKNFDEGPSRGAWVDTQCTMFKRGSLQPDRNDCLVEVVFEFDPSNTDENLHDQQWNSMFQNLKQHLQGNLQRQECKA